MSVTITLEDDIDISRGDMIVGADEAPQVSQDIEMMVCWMSEKKLALNGRYARQAHDQRGSLRRQGHQVQTQHQQSGRNPRR